MKTTIEISDPLLEQARRLAASEHTSLRALVEQGLRQILANTTAPSDFRLRRASFRGNGLQSGDQSASWEQIRAMAYEGHGG